MSISKHLGTSLEDAGIISDPVVSESPQEMLLSAVEQIVVESVQKDIDEQNIENLSNADYALAQIMDSATAAVDGDDRTSFEAANLALSVFMTRDGLEHDRSSFESYSTVPASNEILRRVQTIRKGLQQSIISMESEGQDLGRLINKINKVNSSNRTILKAHQQALSTVNDKIAMTAYGIYDFLHMNGRLVGELSPAIRQDFKVLGEMIKLSKEFDKFYQDLASQSSKAYGSNPNDVRRLLDSIRRFDVKRLLDWTSGNTMLWNGSFVVLKDDFRRSGNRGTHANSFYDESWFEWLQVSVRYANTSHDGSVAPQNTIDEAISRAEELALKDAQDYGASTGGLLGGLLGAVGAYGLTSLIRRKGDLDGLSIVSSLAGMFAGAKLGSSFGRNRGTNNVKPIDRSRVIQNAHYRFRGSNTTVEFTGKDLANACSDAVDICNVLPAIVRSAEMAYNAHLSVLDLIEKRLAARPDVMEYADLVLGIASVFTGKDFTKVTGSSEEVAARNEEAFGLMKDYMTSIYMSQFSLIEAIVNHLCLTVAGVAAVCEKAEAALKNQ